MTADEIERWHQDLERYPIEAIEWAFDNYRRNGGHFPVPRDILEQCRLFVPRDGSRHKCSIECRERHGKGYGENDLLWLWKRFNAKYHDLDRRITDAEHEELLSELDQVRGSAPEWRA